MGPSYNNSFGNSQSIVSGGTGVSIASGDTGIADSAQMPIASGGGDVVLPNVGGNSKRRWPIVVAVLLFVVAIVAGVAAVVMNQKKNVDVVTVRNQYMNLLTSDSMADTAVSNENLTIDAVATSDTRNIYTIPRYFDPLGEDNITYYKNIKMLLGSIRDNAGSKYSGDQRDDLEFFAENSSRLVDYYFVAAALAYTNASYDYYMKNGSLDGMMLVYGYPFAETEDDMLLNFSLTMDLLYDALETYYDSASMASCIVNEEIDYQCMNEKDPGIDAMQEQVSEYTSVLTVQVDKILGLLLADARSINNTINWVSAQ